MSSETVAAATEAAAAAAAAEAAATEAAEASAYDRSREEEDDAAATPAAALRSSGATPSGAPASKRTRSQSSSSSSAALNCRERVARLEEECGLVGLLHGFLVNRIESLEEALEIAPLAAWGIELRIRALEEYIFGIDAECSN